MTKKVDDNGWWIIKDNPLSKVGIYPYLGKQIDDSLEPNKIYRVFRPAEELLNEETVKSFNLVPLVNDHEMLGKDFKPAEEKGIDGIIYNPRVAHGDMLMGNIKIYSEKMMRDIKNGKKELSMGYTCTYDLTPGDWDGQHYDVVQRNLRGNHVALVDKGRMGSDVRVYDKHICCDSMDITGNIKRVRAEDITHDTWRLRKDTGLNYVTKRKESTINRLIKESGLPIARKTEATKLFGMPNYRNRFDAKFKEDEAWLNAQKVRFKQTRKKVGWRKLLEMPSFQRYKAKEEELRDILARRDAIEKEVYGDRAGLDTAWIKVPGEERNEPNIMDKVVTKSAEAAAIMALLSAVLKMNKEKKTAKDSINGVNNMDVMKRKQALDNALNKKLYKIGVAYGKKLAKVYGKKTAQDMATRVAKDILSLKKKTAKDANDPNKWKYSKNLRAGSKVGNTVTGFLADKMISNKKPSYLKDALVEGIAGGLGNASAKHMAIGALVGAPAGLLAGIHPGLGAAAGAAIPVLAHGSAAAANSLVRNKYQKSFPSLSTAQAQGLASGTFGALGGGALGGLGGTVLERLGLENGGLKGAALGALLGGVSAGLKGLSDRWYANKLYAPMPKVDLGRRKK